MRYPGLVFGACALLATWQLVATRPLHWSPGTLAPDDPKQANLENVPAFAYKDVHLTPRAEFDAEVRVLSRNSHWIGALANVSPLDIAVGWGPMSDSAVIEHLDISQSGRFYFWHYGQNPPIPPQTIVTHSANWHVIPASQAVWHTLRRLRVGSIVRLQGELVDITRADGSSIRTSLSREDTGEGACEVIYVQSATLR